MSCPLAVDEFNSIHSPSHSASPTEYRGSGLRGVPPPPTLYTPSTYMGWDLYTNPINFRLDRSQSGTWSACLHFLYTIEDSCRRIRRTRGLKAIASSYFIFVNIQEQLCA
ncbi:hypothetical protein SAY87_014260 [Trapa incisa]|uniref:Uncharacterized protein n=1 Tax=Trapa incisa TaxID=236973 RepID=A0AAN7GZS0_9MYRT|nr:hypothetical protein SAY87_014260 [Trapa incisa]